MRATSLEEVVGLCRVLKDDKTRYKQYSEQAFMEAQKYHIDKIAPLYAELEKE
jgi:hypothetical protein